MASRAWASRPKSRWPGLAERLTAEEFVADVADWAARIPLGERRILAVAGAPGSGKSTLAERIVETVGPGTAAILPMDGFHYDNEVLEARGDRARKGAPHTFDTGGFAAMLGRLRAKTELEVAVPRFDRDLEIARAGARIVPQAVRLIVAEGNYLLLDRPPWNTLISLFDRTAFVDVPEPELARRLRQRWESHDMNEAAIRTKLEGNDLPNARLVARESRTADWLVV